MTIEPQPDCDKPADGRAEFAGHDAHGGYRLERGVGAVPTLSPSELWVVSLFQIIRAKWLLVMLLGLAGTAIAGASAWLWAPEYEASVVMVPAPDPDAGESGSDVLGQLGGLVAFASGGEASPASLKTEAFATLKSRSFIEAFIRENGLMPVLFADEWSSEAGDWRSAPPTLFDAYEFFLDDVLDVAQDLSEGTITLTVTWQDPNRSALWANELVRMLNDRMRTRAIDESRQAISFLERELASTQVIGVQQALYGLLQKNVRKVALANVREEYAFKVIDPALPPDEDGYVRPQRVLLIALGVTVGLLAGVFIAVLTVRLRPHA